MSGFEALTLTNGPLHFSAKALGDGPLVLCLHGFPDTSGTFDGLLAALAEAGFRGVAPAMRGYEPQSQPADSDYHAVRMAGDVAAWIDQLGGGPVHLVGHDWGATIAFAAAALVPDKLRSLTVLAVPHPMRFAENYAASAAQQARSRYIIEFQSPTADAAIVANDCAWLERLYRTWSPGWDNPDAALAAMRQTFRMPGVANATLNWYRQAFDLASEAGQATQALLSRPVGAPTLGLVGEDDGCIAADIFAASMQSADFPAGLVTERISGAGHFLHLEQPAPVMRRLLDWLRQHEVAEQPDYNNRGRVLTERSMAIVPSSTAPITSGPA